MSELEALLDELEARPFEKAVLVTLVRLEGSGYRKAGAQMVIADDGWSFGSVSGGCIEGLVHDAARRAIASGDAQTIEIDTTSDADLLFGSGLGCPGRLQFTFEPFRRDELDVRFGAQRASLARRESEACPIALHVFGAGNDAVPVAALARVLQWKTTIYDAREAFLTTGRFPEPARLVRTRPCALQLDRRSAAVVTTHNYFLDLDWLRALLATDVRSIAIVGSRKRFGMITDVLRGEGLDIHRLRGPAGLDLGSETPAEIALSIVAEVQALFSGRDARPLSVRGEESVSAA